MVKKGKGTSGKSTIKKSTTKKKSVTKSAAKKSAVKKKAVKKVASKAKPKKVVAKKVPKTKTAKKVAKKSPTKSKSPKKTVSKRKKSLWEKKVSGDSVFFTLDHKQLSCIIDLVKELEEMEEHVYHHHVSFQNNDFANWLENVFELSPLAKELRNSHTKDETQLILLKYIIQNS